MTNKDKTYLVTGAATGIGAAIAGKLLSEGAKIVLHYNVSIGKRNELFETYGEERVLPVKANLELPGDIDRLWEYGLSWQGRLDGIVNNAALIPSTLPDVPLDEWREEWAKVMQVNMTAVADLCRYAILHFKDSGGGSIVNISSRAGFRGDLTDSMHYAASKGAMVAFTRSIAKGYAKDNILAYIVAPGWVKTILPPRWIFVRPIRCGALLRRYKKNSAPSISLLIILNAAVCRLCMVPMALKITGNSGTWKWIQP